MNPGKSRDARPAQNMRQHCFRLVVHGVRRRDHVQHSLLSQPREETISCAPRRIFQVCFFAFSFSTHVRVANVQRHVKFLRQRRHEFLVRVRRRAPQIVIEVHRANHNT